MNYTKILYLLHFIWSFGKNLVFKILPSYFASVASASQIGMIYSVSSAAKFFSIPAGWFADKIGKARALFLVFLILPPIAVLFTISDSVFFFTLMFFVIALLGNFYIPSIVSIITTFNEKNTESLFKLESVWQLGAVFGPIIGGLLTLRCGIETAFYVWAGLGVIGLILSSFLLRKEKLVNREVKKPNLKQLLSQLKDKKGDFLVFLMTGGFLIGLFETMIGLSLPLYATKLGFNIFQVGIIIGGASLLSALGLFLLGKKMESIKSSYSLILAISLIGASVLIIIFVQNMIGIILLLGAFIIGRAGGVNIARSFISKNLSENIRATGMAISDNVRHIGKFAGPLIAGLLIDLIDIRASFIFVFVMATLGVISLIIYQKRQPNSLQNQ